MRGTHKKFEVQIVQLTHIMYARIIRPKYMKVMNTVFSSREVQRRGAREVGFGGTKGRRTSRNVHYFVAFSWPRTASSDTRSYVSRKLVDVSAAHTYNKYIVVSARGKTRVGITRGHNNLCQVYIHRYASRCVYVKYFSSTASSFFLFADITLPSPMTARDRRSR